MDSTDLDLLRQARRWMDEPGVRVVLGTVARTWGSAPRPPGSLVAVRIGVDGSARLAGSVSGGCIEDDLVAQLRESALAAPRVVGYGVGDDAARRVGLPCGGQLDLVLEPLRDAGWIDRLLAAIARGERVQRVLDLASGAVTLERAPSSGVDAPVALTDATLVTTHGAHWRLLVIGNGQLTRYLVPIARSLDFAVTVCDPREEHAHAAHEGSVHFTREMPDDVVLAMKPDAHTAVVALTHDPKLDDLALIEALNSDAYYVGALGSRANQAKRRARLAEHFGLSESQLDRLHGPVGLAIGARTPPEIALAIAAELTAVRYGVAP